MMENTQANVSTHRLNPFAFPSDTDFRFVLLIFSVLGTSLFIYQTVYFLIPANHARYLLDINCYQVTGFAACVTPDLWANVEWVGLGIALVLTVAGGIYWAFPSWQIWRDKLQPFPLNEQTQNQMAYLIALCREVGLANTPIFLFKASGTTSGSVAFGHAGRYYVRLNLGLAKKFSTDQAAFRATLLHELSHIRNGDVDKTYFALALVWAFALVALLPMLIILLYSLFFSFNQEEMLIFNVFWRLLIFIPLIYLTLTAILRVREVYADVRASIWDGPSGALSRVLNKLPHTSKSWQRLLLTHPDPQERNRILGNPSRLLQQNFWDTFVTGAIATGFFYNASLLLSQLSLNPEFEAFVEPDILGILFACLIVGIVGLGVWRAIFAKQATGNTQVYTLRTGLVLTLGLLLGQVLSLNAYSSGYAYFTEVVFWRSTWTATASQALVSLLLALLLLLILVLFLHWIAVTAALWLEVAARRPSSRSIYWVAFVVASCILGSCFAKLSQILQDAKALSTMQSLINSGQYSSLIFNLSQDPFICLAFILLWAYPLTVWFWRASTAPVTKSSWTFLDTPQQTQEPIQPSLQPSQSHVRSGIIPVVALVSGLVFCVLQFRLVPGPQINLFITNAVLLQAALATIIAATLRRLGTFHALFAAFICACVTATGIVVYLNILTPGKVSIGVAWLIYLQIVNEGAFLALPLALLAATSPSKIRHLLQRIRTGL
jgi:Zn-dependent protease with chaperone function